MLCVASPCRRLNCEIIFYKINGWNFERRQRERKTELELIVWIIFVCQNEYRFYGEHSMGYKIVRSSHRHSASRSRIKVHWSSRQFQSIYRHALLIRKLSCLCFFLKFQLLALRFIAFQITWFRNTIQRCGVKRKGISSTPQFKDKKSCVIKSRETTSSKSQK